MDHSYRVIPSGTDPAPDKRVIILCNAGSRKLTGMAGIQQTCHCILPA